MNDTINKEKNSMMIARWLWIGVGMIVVQVVLGGITRLTESGLSITEWNPITGALPPLGDAAWQAEFDKYRNIDQFKFVHAHFSLSEFKFIFFWEWFHRLWARIMGLVFLFGFIYFLYKKKFSKNMVTPMVILFFLGGIQGAIGWIMVKSGLVPEKYFVGHVELTTHFIAALILLIYTCWFALKLSPIRQQVFNEPTTRKWLSWFSILFFVQLVYGGFMAGLKAAVVAPTWPDINGDFIPKNGWTLSPYMINFVNDPLVVHFMHRGIGYLLLILTILFFFKTKSLSASSVFNRYRWSFVVLVFTQICLGILTIINATDRNSLTWLGVLHQFTAILIALCITTLMFLLRKNRGETTA